MDSISAGSLDVFVQLCGYGLANMSWSVDLSTMEIGDSCFS